MEATVVLVLDLVGTFVFALSGAMVGAPTVSMFSAFWCWPSPLVTPAGSPATS